jgi:uncharacterized tellurite resistance protein B-like protein
MKQHVATITNLLLGAAYADKRLEGEELMAIRKVLGKILGQATLPPDRETQIKTFNPARFDAQSAAAGLTGLSDDEKRNLLELVATVTESDEELDLAESEYLRKVARGLGIAEDSIKDLTIEVLDDDELEHFFDAFES